VAAVGAAAFLLHAATACPTVWFGDSGELIAAAQSLGVAHPPGYPFWTGLARLFLLLPWGEPAYRVALFSALAAATSCGLAALLVLRATGSRLGGIGAGTFLAVSSTFWSVATVAEVYALHVLLGISLLLAARSLGEGGGRRALVVLSAVFGLALAHHPTIVLWLPSAIVLASRKDGRWRLPARTVAILAAFAGSLAVAAALYGWMLLRARGGPSSNWGDPSTWSALRIHVSAEAFRHLDLGWRALLRGEGWSRLLRIAGRDLAWLGFAAGGVGFALGRRPLASALGILAIVSCAFGLRYSVDDPEVFVLPALVAVAIAGGLAAARIEETGREGRAAALLLVAAVVAASVLTHGRARSLRGVTAGLDYARDVLDGVPRGGTLFVESDDAFPVLYATAVLGERRDVTIYHRRGVLFRDLTREVAPPPGAPPDWRADRLRVERAFLGRELVRDSGVEFWFLGWPGYDPPPPFRFEPVGLLWRLAREDRPGPAVPAPSREASVRGAAEREGGTLARAFAAIYPLSRGERALARGDRATAEREIEDALRVAGRGSAIPAYVGTVWARAGEMDRAIDAFRRAVERNPAAVRVWENLARALEETGDRDGARRARERARALVR
jgi:hypothetical protein